MKITLTHYDETITIETDRDDLDLEEMCQMFKHLLLASGYSFNGEVVIDEPDTGDSLQGD